MDEVDSEETPISRLKDTAKTIGGCLTYIAFTVGALVLLVAFIKGTPWIAENVYPWVIKVAAVVIFLVIPVSLLLAVFRTTRGIAGIGLFSSSYIIGLSLWIWSLIVAYVLAGVFWMIVGILLGGIGVVPIALIAALLKSEWATAGQIAIVAIVVFALRAFGLFVAAKTG